MMRKNIKTGLIAFGMCLALPFCSFAAVEIDIIVGAALHFGE